MECIFFHFHCNSVEMYTIVQIALAVTAAVIVSAVLYFKRTFGYWKRKNVPYLKPSIPMGNLEFPLFLKKGVIGVLVEAYNVFKSQGRQYGGIYFLNKPIFVPTDPELVKSILTKDFPHFMNRGNLIDTEAEPLTANLLNVEDETWRSVRTQLTPTFTSGKMKTMFNTVSRSCDQMIEHIKQLATERKPLPVKDIVSRYSIDVIGSCAFGLDCNSFKDPDAEFRRHGQKLTRISFGNFRLFLLFVMPELHKIFRFRIFDKEASEFLSKVFRNVLENRVATSFNPSDFVQLLLEVNAGHAKSIKSLTTEEMIAQALGFFIAGFETSSSNLSFCLYKLALHRDVQEKLRVEVKDVLGRYGGEVSYEALGEMKYMDQVIDETLRFYPPLPFLNRKCSKDYIVPGTDVKIEKGTTVMVSVLGLHMDEEYYPNAQKFDPERFTKENKANRHQYVHIPFGDGPRICIGKRFAMMQIKLGLASILMKFKILPHDSTPKSLTYSPSDIVIACTEKLLLNAQLL